MSDSPGNPKTIDTLVISDDEETPSLSDPTSGRLLITNQVGKRVIELSDGSRDVSRLTDHIFEEFEGATRDEIRRHILHFLNECVRKGLVVWV